MRRYLYLARRAWREWLDPFAKVKRLLEEERRRRKVLAFGYLYGVGSTAESSKAFGDYINGVKLRDIQA